MNAIEDFEGPGFLSTWVVKVQAFRVWGLSLGKGESGQGVFGLGFRKLGRRCRLRDQGGFLCGFRFRLRHDLVYGSEVWEPYTLNCLNRGSLDHRRN